jgi:hypothetical protein
MRASKADQAQDHPQRDQHITDLFPTGAIGWPFARDG